MVTLTESSSASRSFADLSLLYCAGTPRADNDSDMDEMKDLRSFTGVNTAYRVMAVSPSGKQLLFKKNNKQLYLYDVDDLMQCVDFSIVGIDISHENDTVFDIAFLNINEVCVILQKYDGRLYATKGTLDFQTKSVMIRDEIKFTQILCKKHYSTTLIYDKSGPVLISYPISFQNRESQGVPKIWLLHINSFFTRKGVQTVSIEADVKDKKALYCDPFIYRNHVYLFNRFESTILSVQITGRDRGCAKVVSSYPDIRYQRPNNKYANRCLLLLDDILLVYCHQRLDKPDQEPQLWILDLRSMVWHRLQLILNHHYPVGQVSFQKSSAEPLAFLHGECGRGGCLEKVHLYQLSLMQSCITPCDQYVRSHVSLIDRKGSTDSSRRSVSTVDLHRTMPTCSDTTTVEQNRQLSSAHVPPAVKYMKKNNRDKVKKSSTEISQNQQSSSSYTSPDSQLTDQHVHWSEEMAEEGGTLTITEQLRLAKDMGYSDEEIMQAISMNCAKDGSYRAFTSTNAMIDMLARVQRMYDTSAEKKCGSDFELERRFPCCCFSFACSRTTTQHKHDDDDDHKQTQDNCTRNSSPNTPSSSIRRAISFHNASSSRRSPIKESVGSSFHEMHRSGPPQFQLQRLLDAFEKEQKSYNDESTRSIRALEERCRQLADNQAIYQVRLLEKESEIQLLQAQLHTRESLDEQLRTTKAKLEGELLESKSKADQIRILTEQSEVVKRQHENEIREKDKLISELFSKLKAAEDANKPALEKNEKLQCEIEELKQQLAKKQADLDKCENYYDEMRKAEQLIEQIRLERDEVRSTLNKIPTCVICLDKRPQMLYMPCSHFICCEGCGGRFENCPACRQKICGKITVYQ